MRFFRDCLFLLLLCPLASCAPRATVGLRAEFGYDPTQTPLVAPADKPAQTVAAADPADELARQAAAATPFLSPQDTFVLRQVDNKTTVISTAIPESPEAAYTVLRPTPPRIVRVTDLASYFEVAATAAENSPCPVVIVLYSDGLDDGERQRTTERIEAAAQRLADNPRVRAVLLIGLVRETRPRWKGLPEMLACLNQGRENRLYVQPQAGMNPDAVLQLLDQVRDAASLAQTAR